MTMVPDTFVIHALIPRELWEDKPVRDTYFAERWRESIAESGGEPIDESPAITEGLKRRGDTDLLWGMDDTGWDAIWVRVHGRAYRDDTRA